MFLVHDDQSHIIQRREDGGSGADHDIRFAASDPLPLVAPFPFGQSGMEHRHPITDPGAEVIDHLRGQSDFGDKNQRRPFAPPCLRNRPKVDFRFARSGDAIQQSGVRLLRIQSLLNFRNRVFLFSGGHRRDSGSGDKAEWSAACLNNRHLDNAVRF